MATALGVDGCKAGWFFLRRDGDVYTHGIASSVQGLANSIPRNSRVFIDIPIGLVERETTGRGCDAEARKLLGRVRASSVFSAPCRSVLYTRDYEEAKRVSLQAIGKKLSKQAYAIVPKIREVDEFLLNSDREIAIREVHPEVCFWALNGRKPVISRKKDEAGFEERLRLLSRYVPKARDLVIEVLDTYLRRDVARDDVLDALVALVVACTSDDALQTLPEDPATDPRGLPMEMVFAEHPDDRALEPKTGQGPDFRESHQNDLSKGGHRDPTPLQPDAIRWIVHFASSPDRVFDFLATDAGRSSFWAESAPESNGWITFHFLNHEPVMGRVLQVTPPDFFAVEYFGARVEFRLEEDGVGGTDLTLISTGVPEDEHVEVLSGWVSVLMAMKAAVDFGIDLRNHDESRTWSQGYADN